jgi:SNF2 family DNA or RNA helicase
LAVSRLCELDAALKTVISEGNSVQISVPFEPRLIDGPHAAAEQIIPLLLPWKIDYNLYNYQRRGVAWLLRHERALLADDMGLGKTAQAIAAARRLIRDGIVSWALVVAPRTLIANWSAEARRWAPELTVATALPIGGDREDRWWRLVRRAHLLLTSYEQLREPAEALVRNSPELAIADEAHRLRNIESQSTQGFRSLNLNRIWALTGTPIERDTEDLAVIMSLLDPARFSPDDKSLPPSSLRARLRPYMLRRRKGDLLEELPPVMEDNEVLELTPAQQTAYESAILEHSRTAGAAGVLPLFNKLRTICDMDPATGASTKLDRIVELLSDIKLAEEKAIVFSYMLEPLRLLQNRLTKVTPTIGYSTITGEMTLGERSAALQEFKTNQACTALLISTRVGSEGLTLTEANHVIFINRWWNPSANIQARDRVVRIGQSRIVHVETFTCRGTVEERLENILKEKSLTFEELIEALAKSPARVGENLFAPPGS